MSTEVSLTNRRPLEAAIAALRSAAQNFVSESERMLIAKAAGLIEGYDSRWFDAGWKTISVEHEFHLPIVNPKTGARSRSFTQAGKYDGIVEHVRRPGVPYLMEHKTTSDDIADQNSTYWRRLAIDSQVSAYVLANWQDGVKVEGTLYDVIRKPAIRAKKLSKAERAAFVASGTYFGKRFGTEVRQEFANELETETPEMFASRLSHDCKERPDWYFQRRLIPRLDQDIVEYAEELWDVATEIRNARQTGRWFRNSGACLLYNSPCAFLGICSGHSTIDDGRWKQREKQHAELSNDAENVLTHSSMQDFKTCRRKFYYRHIEQIERVDDEDSESLRLGSLLHLALEAWWSCFLISESEVAHEYSECSATGVDHRCSGSADELV